MKNLENVINSIPYYGGERRLKLYTTFPVKRTLYMVLKAMEAWQHKPELGEPSRLAGLLDVNELAITSLWLKDLSVLQRQVEISRLYNLSTKQAGLVMTAVTLSYVNRPSTVVVSGGVAVDVTVEHGFDPMPDYCS